MGGPAFIRRIVPVIVSIHWKIQDFRRACERGRRQRVLGALRAALRAGGGKGEEFGFQQLQVFIVERAFGGELHQNRKLQYAHCIAGHGRLRASGDHRELGSNRGNAAVTDRPSTIMPLRYLFRCYGKSDGVCSSQ